MQFYNYVVKRGPEAYIETGPKCRTEYRDNRSSFNSFILLSDKHSVITWQRNVAKREYSIQHCRVRGLGLGGQARSTESWLEMGVIALRRDDRGV